MKVISWIWSEDDSGAHDRERLDDAWERIYKNILIRADFTEIINGGDHFIYQHKTFHWQIYMISCEGSSVGIMIDTEDTSLSNKIHFMVLR